MLQTKLKPAALLAGAAALLALAVSCNKETQAAVSDGVVSRACVTAAIGDRDAGKATFSSNNLSWAVGDKVVMVSNGQVNGTLTCTAAGDPATFEGEVSQFTPEGVDLYFLGNHDADGVRSSFDLSRQAGSQDALVGFLFLKTDSPVVLTKAADGPNGEEQYECSGTVNFGTTPLIPFLELRNLDKGLVMAGLAAEEDLTGVKASSVKIDGLKNRLDIDLASGTVSAGMMSTTTVTTISPVKAADRANSYYLAVVPQTAEDVTLQVNYIGSDTPMLTWSGIAWTISGGASYYTDWGKQSGLSFGALSTKGGYNGVAVEGGENPDGLNNKRGYNGHNADGTVDDPQGAKTGYDGVGI